MKLITIVQEQYPDGTIYEKKYELQFKLIEQLSRFPFPDLLIREINRMFVEVQEHTRIGRQGG